VDINDSERDLILFIRRLWESGSFDGPRGEIEKGIDYKRAHAQVAKVLQNERIAFMREEAKLRERIAELDASCAKWARDAADLQSPHLAKKYSECEAECVELRRQVAELSKEVDQVRGLNADIKVSLDYYGERVKQLEKENSQ